jgi:hypothetical protein
MAADEESRDSEADPQRHTQGAIHSPHIQKRCHIASAIRLSVQDCCGHLTITSILPDGELTHMVLSVEREYLIQLSDIKSNNRLPINDGHWSGHEAQTL